MPSSVYDILNDCWDTANNALKCLVSYVHTHVTDAQGGKLDHGTAHTSASLLDDDHTIYQKESLLTTQGDMPYATGASTWARLPKGTGGQYLAMNGGATAPEWVSATPVPSGGIILWHGTIANIPAAFVICDGNNSTPNLLAKFVEGVATAATDPGATGGATSKTTSGHTHTGPSHTHTNPNTGIMVAGGTGAGSSGSYTQVTTHYHGQGSTGASGTGTTGSQTDSISDIRPLYYDIAFIMKT